MTPVLRFAAVLLVSVFAMGAAFPADAGQGIVPEKTNFMGSLLDRSPPSGMKGITVSSNVTTSKKLNATEPTYSQAEYDKAFVENLNNNQALRNQRVAAAQAEYSRLLAADQAAAQAGNAKASSDMAAYYNSAAAGTQVAVPGMATAPAVESPEVRRVFKRPEKTDDAKPVRLFNMRDRSQQQTK